MNNKQQNKRTIKELLSPECQVYVWISSADVLEQFHNNASNEGFSLNKNVKKTSFIKGHFLHVQDDMTIDYPSYSGFCGAMAFQSKKFTDGKLVVKVDYEKYLAGDIDYYYGGQCNIDIDELVDESTDKYGISDGTSAILIREPGLQDNLDFFTWLQAEGFRYWSYSKGWYPNVDCVYINLNSKLIARGMPGIGITKAFGNQAITTNEFKQIYIIYQKKV